ncbi:uncharacterized protein EI97DRAFT_8586 [Westerdykella ornata]|uniref:Uncharacterized protein n=1 Tax=Westerdykella ornata TaxID=318751 RepID=A0A6A6JW14_WESOR|nr:uncharacterized protein EI97DRAFT_8586 [Westerdykella ornata]KAF2280801.1 hypothetical protein EI97DRAFT_8586 [Westerdykella ornata]
MQEKKRASSTSPKASVKRPRAPERTPPPQIPRTTGTKPPRKEVGLPGTGPPAASKKARPTPEPVTRSETLTNSAILGPKPIESVFQTFPRELTERIFGGFSFKEIREICKGGKLMWLMVTPYLYSVVIISPLAMDVAALDRCGRYYEHTRVLTVHIPQAEVTDHWDHAESIFRHMIRYISNRTLRVVSFTPATILNTATCRTLCQLLEKATQVTKIYLPPVTPQERSNNERTDLNAWVKLRRYNEDGEADLDLVVAWNADVQLLKTILHRESSQIISMAILGTIVTPSDALNNSLAVLGYDRNNPLNVKELQLCRLDLTQWHETEPILGLKSLQSLAMHECIDAENAIESASREALKLKRFVLTNICESWTPTPPQHNDTVQAGKEDG